MLSQGLGHVDRHRRGTGGRRDSDPTFSAGDRTESGKGSAFGGARGRTDVPKIVDWYMDGKIRIDELITHTLPHARVNDAFDLMHAGASIRTVLTY